MASDTSHEPGNATNREKSNGQKCLILIGGTYNVFVSLGVMFSINTLYVELLDVFQTTRKETSFVQTTFLGITFGSGLITGIIVRRIGIKIGLIIGAVLAFLGFFLGWFAMSVPYLIATIGIISGFGNSIIYISTMVFIATTFNERRSLALAITTVGSGLGQIFISLVLERLLDAYGWRGSLLLASGLYLNIIVSCLLTTSSLGADIPFKLETGKNIEADDTKAGRWQDVVKPMFLLFVLNATLSLGSTANMAVLFMDYMDSQGLTLKTGINVFIGYNVLGLVTRLCAGAVSLSKHIHSLVLFCSFSLLFGCCMLLLRVSSSFTSNVILLCLMGGGTGGLIGLVSFVTLELCGVEHATIALGIPIMSFGIFIPVIGVLIGWLFDSTGSYSVAFDVCGYITVGSALATLISFCGQSCVQRRKRMPKCNKDNT